MKKILPFILIVLCACNSSNTSLKPDYMDISVIGDATDFHILYPDASSVLLVFNLSEHKNEAVTFRYSEVSDKILAPITIIHLPATSATKQKNRKNDPLFREKFITTFYDSIKKTLSPVKSNSSFLERSQCFHAISRELIYLSQSTSTRKLLLVFSNLYENSDLTSVYTDQGKKILRTRPQAIANLFEQANLLPKDLAGVTIVFVYQPRNIEDDKQYNSMVNNIYRPLLEKRKANVIVQASNTFYDL
jgi:hypothetical protein